MTQRLSRLALRWTLPVVLLVGSVLLSLSAASDAPIPPAPHAARPGVRVALVEPARVVRSARLSGVTRARHRARLAFETGGRLVERTVEAGARFRAGQVLARLDARPLDNTVATAEAAVAEIAARLDQQSRERDRTHRLFDAGAASREEVEQIDAGVVGLRALADAAAARLREARRASAEGVLVAPFDGTVVAVGLQAGEFASPGATVLEVAGDGAVEVEVEVPETFVDALRPGEAVRVRLPFAGREVTGTVATRGAAAGGVGRLFPVVVAIDRTAGVLAGMTAEIEVVAGGAQALSVPLSAVVNPGGARPAVFRVVDGRAERVAVELGGIVGDRVAVSGGLAAGDRVVVAGAAMLADGDLVEVRS